MLLRETTQETRPRQAQGRVAVATLDRRNREGNEQKLEERDGSSGTTMRKCEERTLQAEGTVSAKVLR